MIKDLFSVGENTPKSKSDVLIKMIYTFLIYTA